MNIDTIPKGKPAGQHYQFHAHGTGLLHLHVHVLWNLIISPSECDLPPAQPSSSVALMLCMGNLSDREK